MKIKIIHERDMFVEMMSLAFAIAATFILVVSPSNEVMNKLFIPMMGAFLSGLIGYYVGKKIGNL